jgi:hypothetical protein
MAYRNPVFYIFHEFTTAVTITESNAPDAGAKGNLWDYRQDERAHWDAANPLAVEYKSTRPSITTGVYQELDTAILPAGTDFSDAASTFSIWTADDLAFTADVVNHVSAEAVPSALLVESFLNASASSTHEYLRIVLASVGSSTADIGEIWLSQKREMSRGPDPGWDISSRSHKNDFTSMAGIDSSRITGPSVSTFRLAWNSLSGTDLDVIDDLLELAGTARPFYFTPPDTRYPEVMLCRLSRDPQLRQQRSNPGVSGPAYEVTLDLIEVAG